MTKASNTVALRTLLDSTVEAMAFFARDLGLLPEAVSGSHLQWRIRAAHLPEEAILFSYRSQVALSAPVLDEDGRLSHYQITAGYDQVVLALIEIAGH